VNRFIRRFWTDLHPQDRVRVVVAAVFFTIGVAIAAPSLAVMFA
jgi:hypothetical protein